MAIAAPFYGIYLVKRRIDNVYPGGVARFREVVLPAFEDDHLVAFTCMSPSDVDIQIEALKNAGFAWNADPAESDIVVSAEPWGPPSGSWLEFGEVGGFSGACWLRGTQPGRVRRFEKPCSHAQLFRQMVSKGEIRDTEGQIFTSAPPALDQPELKDRIRGMLLGVAIGDALGAPTEATNPSQRQRRYGEIRDYVPNRYGEERGCPTDDTQLTFWTVEHLLEADELVLPELALAFSTRRIFGLGNTVRRFLRNIKSGSIAGWRHAGVPSAGNGALMRMAPLLIPHLHAPSEELWADVALAASLTHDDQASTSICLTFVRMLWELLDMRTAPPPRWWLEQYVEVADDLETESSYKPRAAVFDGYSGRMVDFTRDVILEARQANRSALEACNRWYSGAYVMETWPSVLYLLERHAHEPEEAIIRAVNDTRDNDTIASIVGAAVGALHGAQAFPARWVEGLTGRLGTDDDGAVFHLIDRALHRFAGP